MNLPNDIKLELLVRYVAKLTSLEENLLVEATSAIDPQINLEISRINDLLFKMAQANARLPRKSLKEKILQTIVDWENNGTLWVAYCPN